MLDSSNGLILFSRGENEGYSSVEQINAHKGLKKKEGRNKKTFTLALAKMKDFAD